MYRIIFTDYFIIQMENFISVMCNYYTNFYSYTGIYNEDILYLFN